MRRSRNQTRPVGAPIVSALMSAGAESNSAILVCDRCEAQSFGLRQPAPPLCPLGYDFKINPLAGGGVARRGELVGDGHEERVIAGGEAGIQRKFA